MCSDGDNSNSFLGATITVIGKLTKMELHC